MTRITIVGGGIVGLWTAAVAARRGHDVTLHERISIGHDRGSSHGDTRIFRSAYWEGAEYVALARLSAEEWDWLSETAGLCMLEMTGTYYAGGPDSPLVCGVEGAARAHRLDLMRLHNVSGILPGAHSNTLALREAAGGIVRADASLAALADYCRKQGATILEHSPYVAARDPESVMIRCLGPWFADDPLLGQYLTSARVYCHWFRHDGSTPLFEKAFLLQGDDGRVLYGMRTADREIKVGWHNYPILPMEPGHAEDSSPQQYIDDIQQALTVATQAPVKHLWSKGCYFTNSLDENYIVDWVGPNALVAGGLSGHGFKFAPALGVGLVKATETGEIPNFLKNFGLSRFGTMSGRGRTHLLETDIQFGLDWRI